MERGKVGSFSANDLIKRSPIFTFTSLYLTGILVGSRYYVNPQTLVLCIIISLLLAILLIHICYKSRTFFSDWFLPIFLSIMVLTAGWINIDASKYIRYDTSNSTLLGLCSVIVDCKITGSIVEKPKSYQVEVSVVEFQEKALLYLSKKTSQLSFQTGDTLRCLIKPKKIENYIGSAFDYAGYMEKRGFYTSSYVKSGDYKVLKLSSPSVKERVDRLRQRYIRRVISSWGVSDESATLVALTIGEKSFLSKETKLAFSNSGTMHLLAVSGLHVSFIYSLLSALLSIFGMSSVTRVLRFIVISGLLWGYTAIVGFSPSITRAALMATLYEFSRMIERDGGGVNSLSISALLITIVRPQSLFELGFQLSYSALLSIILIHPYIEKLLYTKSKIIKYIWTTLSMSLACQIGTSIITISTFHYFPTYFLFTNLVAIPLSAVILYIAVLQVVTMGVEPFQQYVVAVLFFLIRFLNWFIAKSESLPFAVVKLSLNQCQIVALITLIIITTFDITLNKKITVYTIIILIIIVITTSFQYN